MSFDAKNPYVTFELSTSSIRKNRPSFGSSADRWAGPKVQPHLRTSQMKKGLDQRFTFGELKVSPLDVSHPNIEIQHTRSKMFSPLSNESQLSVKECKSFAMSSVNKAFLDTSELKFIK